MAFVDPFFIEIGQDQEREMSNPETQESPKNCFAACNLIQNISNEFAHIPTRIFVHTQTAECRK